MNRKILVVLGVLAMVLLSSCRTSKKITRKEIVKEFDVEMVTNKMKESELQFETISLKADVKAKINRKKSHLNATLRIQRDSMIWISITPGLGIEAARLLITQDSLFFMNRLTKEYFCTDFDYVARRFQVDIDYNILQALLLGNDFSNYEDGPFRLAYESGCYQLNATERSKKKRYIRNHADAQRILVQSLLVEPETFKINQIRVKTITEEQRKLESFYDQFEETEEQLLPLHVVWEIVAKSGAKGQNGKKTETQKIFINLLYSKIVLNNDIAVPFNIPNKYNKMVILAEQE